MNTKNSSEISVVIPAFNSEETLLQLVSQLDQVLSNIANNYEIILVNDGSKDNSWEHIKTLAQKYLSVTGVNLARNYGQHNALLCGVRLAKYPIVVTMDDDLQNPPEEIPKLTAKLKEGYDLVYGLPMDTKHGFWRNFSSQFMKNIISLVTGNSFQNTGTFRAFKTKLRDCFANYNSPHVSLDVLLVRNATNIGNIKVRHDERKQGTSNYNFRKLILHGLNLIFSSSILPLRIISVFGILIAGFGFLLFIYVLGHYFFVSKVVPGFTFLGSIIALFSGTQLLTLGIIGEYIGRIHFRLMDYPSYAVGESTKEF